MGLNDVNWSPSFVHVWSQKINENKTTYPNVCSFINTKGTWNVKKFRCSVCHGTSFSSIILQSLGFIVSFDFHFARCCRSCFQNDQVNTIHSYELEEHITREYSTRAHLPRSMIIILSLGASNMLAGFKSRWARPHWCTASRPSQTCRK